MYTCLGFKHIVEEKVNVNVCVRALPADTMATTIDVVVDELCKSTVVITPSISATIGFLSSALSENARPVQRARNDSDTHLAVKRSSARSRISVYFAHCSHRPSCRR